MLAPPGRPNTTSTPSALRHSITASTARMRIHPSRCVDVIRAALGGSWVPSVPSVRGRLDWCRRSCGWVLELGPAAGAQRVVHRDDLAAARAAAIVLFVLVAVEDRGQQPDERRDRRDQEPEEERAALDLADDPAGETEEERDDDEL